MQEMAETKQRRFVILLFLLVLLGLFLAQLLDFGPANAEDRGGSRLPVSIRASAQADYSRDTDALVVQPVSENIFEQIIHDLQGTGEAQDRISTLEVSLSMPVPTMTLNPLLPTSTLPPITSTPVVTGSTTPTSQTTTALPSITSTALPTTTGTAISVSPPAASTADVVPARTKKPKPTKPPKPTKRP